VKRAIVSLLLLILCGHSMAADWVMLEDQDRYLLSQRLKYLEDETSSLSIDNVLTLPDDHWVASNNANTSLGYSESAYWFKLSFDVQHSSLWYLWLRYAPHDDVGFYWVQDDKVLEFQQSGDAFPFSIRSVQVADHAVARQLNKGEQIHAYIRVKTEGSYRIPLEIRQRSSFEAEHTAVTAFQGTYYGVLLVMSVFNLVLFFITNIRSYLYYVFYVFTSLASRLSIDNTGFQFLWPSLPQINEWVVPIAFWSSGIAFLVFTYTFLNVRKASQNIKYYFWFLGLLGGMLGIGVFTMSYHQVVPLTTFYAMLLMFSSLISAIIMTFSGHKYAGVFAIATIMTALSFSLTVLDSLGFFSDQTLMLYSYPISRTFEIVLFAIALGVRIRFLQNRRLEAEREAIANREQAIRNIEQYKRLYDSAVTGNFVLTLDGKIQNGNDAFYELVDDKARSQRNFNHYFIDDKSDVFIDAFSNTTFQMQCDCELVNGKWVSVFLNRINDEDGSHLEGSMVDISDRIHAEQIQQLAENDKMQAMQQLVVGVAHEMNTPLGIVRTSSDYARDSLERMAEDIDKASMTKSDCLSLLNSSGEALRLADENLERMADLIRSFKDVSVEQMQFSAELLDVDLLFARLKQEAKEIGLELDGHVTHSGTSAFTSFPDAVFWVVVELMKNTLSHSHEVAGKVLLHLTDEHLNIEYSDEGQGVDEEYLNHIFEPFFTTKRGSNKKLGLGLYQLHNIVTLLLKSQLHVRNDNGLKYDICIPNLDTQALTTEKA